MVLAVRAVVARVLAQLAPEPVGLGELGPAPARGRPPTARDRSGAGVRPWVFSRSALTTSRRICGFRPLKPRGIRTLPSAFTGVPKSIMASLRA
ncbi:hypothetical protein [Nocardioides cavernaquae]|uniref:hypothetical protein n=1 Tax=Nocardioides cavernaquae TaxID=2321396 RepID=UPI001EE531A8|nr:hypothetical protein [Nocardioides cavernaquae]